MGLDAHQVAHLGVDEGTPNPGRQSRRLGDGQEVGEHRPGVPVQVAQPPLPVFPGGAPRDPCQHQACRRVRHLGLGGRTGQVRAVIAGPQKRQAEVERGEVVDAGTHAG